MKLLHEVRKIADCNYVNTMCPINPYVALDKEALLKLYGKYSFVSVCNHNSVVCRYCK